MNHRNLFKRQKKHTQQKQPKQVSKETKERKTKKKKVRKKENYMVLEANTHCTKELHKKF